MFVTGAYMNFDLNAISALMQMMGKTSTAPTPAQEKNSAGMSPFARENGLGEKAYVQDNSKQKPHDALTSILGMMSGKPSEGGEGAASILPLLMNLIKKPEPPKTNAQSAPQTSEYDSEQNATARHDHAATYENMPYRNATPAHENRQNATTAPKATDTNDLAPRGQFMSIYKKDGAHSNGNISGQGGEKYNEKLAHGEIFAPISFAGYALISALNILYNSSN